MPRSYLHIKEYENEILELKAQRKTNREICKKFGFRMKQLKCIIARHNNNKKKLKAGVAIRHLQRIMLLVKKTKSTNLEHLSLKYSKTKSLEMQNESMQDFLSLTERK